MNDRAKWIGHAESATALSLLLCLNAGFADPSTLPDSVVPCAPCHDRRGNGQVGEWLASPYSQVEGGRGCADCHGSRCRGTGDATASGGYTTDVPAQSPGAAAGLTMTAVCSDGVVEAEIAVANIGAGHDLPTGPPGRTLVLEVTARGWDGLPLVPREPPGPPVFVGAPGAALGRVFVNHPPAGSSGSHRSQLAPFETDVTRYRFTAPESGPAHVRARLILATIANGKLEIARSASVCGPSIEKGEAPP